MHVCVRCVVSVCLSVFGLMYFVHVFHLYTQLLSESEQRLIESHAAKEKSENEKEDLNQQVSALTR